MKKFFRAITFRGHYAWLPTVVAFWYFSFIVTVSQIAGIHLYWNLLWLFFAFPAWVVFTLLIDFGRLRYVIGHLIFIERRVESGPFPTIITPTLGASIIIFSLGLLGVFLINLTVILLLRWIRTRNVTRGKIVRH